MVLGDACKSSFRPPKLDLGVFGGPLQQGTQAKITLKNCPTKPANLSLSVIRPPKSLQGDTVAGSNLCNPLGPVQNGKTLCEPRERLFSESAVVLG